MKRVNPASPVCLAYLASPVNVVNPVRQVKRAASALLGRAVSPDRQVKMVRLA